MFQFKTNKSITNIIALMLGLLLVTGCGGANFSGDSSSSRQVNNDSTNEPQPEVLDPQNDSDQGSTTTPVASSSPPVYQIYVSDLDLSLTGSTIELNILQPNQEALVFIHVLAPSTIVIDGSVNNIAGLFLSANSTFSTSAAFLQNGSSFPTNITASKFGTTVNKGSELINVVGQNAYDLWAPFTIIETYAAGFGERKCFFLDFESSIDNNPSFNLEHSNGQACPY